MWTFWKDKEDFIYLLPLVACYCDKQCLMFKFGWLKWRDYDKIMEVYRDKFHLESEVDEYLKKMK